MTGKIQTTVLRISGAIDVVASIITSFAIIVLVAAVLLQVVARYIFQQPPPYTEELARYAMIWAGLIGASMAFKRRFDPALMNGVKNGPPWMQVAAEIIRSATTIGAKLCRLEGEAGEISKGASADMIIVDGDPLSDISLLGDDGAHMALIMARGRLHKSTLV